MRAVLMKVADDEELATRDDIDQFGRYPLMEGTISELDSFAKGYTKYFKEQDKEVELYIINSTNGDICHSYNENGEIK